MKPEMEILCKEECYKIVGACMTVHTELGHGFLEAIYQEALALELKSMGITYNREMEIKVFYKGIALNKPYKADFICYDKIIIELKSTFMFNKRPCGTAIELHESNRAESRTFS